MFAQWPGEVLFDILVLIIQFITLDNFSIFNPATSQTQAVVGNAADRQEMTK